jgi:cardiolipin synthase
MTRQRTRGTGLRAAYAGPVAAQQRVSDRVLTIPNALSVLRLVLVPVFFWLLLTRRDGAAIVVLAVSGTSDYLDGMLARRWGQVSRLGQLLDPFADRLYILSTLVGLAWREIIPWWLVAALVARDLVLATTIPVLARHGYGPLPVHLLGKAATFNLLYAFPLLLLAQGSSTAAAIARPIAWAFAWWGLVLYWWTGWLYLRQVRQLSAAAPASGGTSGESGDDG